MPFTRNQVCGTHAVFSKEEILRFHICNFENVKSLGRKVLFFNSLGTTKISTIFKLSVYTHVVLLINFLEQFELRFYFKYWKRYEVL